MFSIKGLIIGIILLPFLLIIIQLVEFGWNKNQAIRKNIGANLFQFMGALIFLIPNLYYNIYSTGLYNILIMVSILFVLATTFKLFKIKVVLSIFIISGIVLGLLLILSPHIFTIPVILGIYSLSGVFIILTRILKKPGMLMIVILIEFFIFGSATLLMSTIFNKTVLFSENIWDKGLYLVEYSIFIVVWNYTIQLKRTSIIMSEIDNSSKLLNQIHKDLSILNNIYYNKSTTYRIQDLYKQIFDIMKLRFNIEQAVLFINEDSVLSPKYSVGFYDDEIEFLGILSMSNINENSVDDFPGALSDVKYQDLLLSKVLLSGLSFPLYTRGNNVGSLYIGIKPNSTIINGDKEILLLICRQLASIIYGAQIHTKFLESQSLLENTTSTDYLTGIYNRREFFIQFRGELKSAMRHKDNMSLFIVNLDNLKKVNNIYGYKAGDLVLINVVNVIRQQLRKNDLFARYGGKEFVGVLLRTNNKGSIKKLQKLINDISEIKIPDFLDIKIIISVGCCQYNNDYKNVESMIKRADIALYKAKKSADNKICVS